MVVYTIYKETSSERTSYKGSMRAALVWLNGKKTAKNVSFLHIFIDIVFNQKY